MRVVLLFTMLLGACSGDTNINQFFVSKEQEESVDALLQQAESDYNAGEFSDALKSAEKAYAINANNEEVVVLLGYIHLSMAGIDTFQLAKGLIKIEEDKKKAATSLVAEDNSAASTLASMSTLLGITSEDLLKLGTESASSKEYFKAYPVILPKSATAAREAGVSSIEHVNKAISYICPFVDQEAKILVANGFVDDPRHTADKCPATSNTRHFKAKAHFLWAFSHLTEALAFYSVLLYQPEGSASPNLQLRADSLKNNSSKINIVDVPGYYSEFAQSVDAILPANDNDSQLRAVLNGLKATSLGFGRLAGVPDTLTKSIDKALTNIESKRGQVQGGTNADKDSAVLKGQLTEKAAKTLSTQISAKAAEDPVEFAAKKSEICSSYSAIAGPGATPPAECQ